MPRPACVCSPMRSSGSTCITTATFTITLIIIINIFALIVAIPPPPRGATQATEPSCFTA